MKYNGTNSGTICLKYMYYVKRIQMHQYSIIYCNNI